MAGISLLPVRDWMSISKHLIELMGGNISVESTPGKGSKFFIKLPMLRANSKLENKLSPMEFEGVRVLIVDDNQTNLDILQSQLEGWHMEVECALGGEAALLMMTEAVKAEDPFQLVILDMHMPKMDGLQLAHIIHSKPHLSNARL